ncbi:spliceosome-associated protein CWC27 homolog isoform X1 [Vespa velutina]|uniref:spliceosome-associated protein CWC27 homolog isoform X1 n=1 Tax=Vespa velutina TaxID=202808 RepID=UPI001FB23C1F|nr:spliceosome-associated protein CWC27 homolog isoform X1 [Vespa velutina]
MSNVYIQEPPTTGKVLMKTSVGDIEIELWAKETPKACRNFIQLCMENYYDNTIFHRVVKGFIVQGGDPTSTGEGGESIYGSPFKDEFHTRLRFCRRGLLAMANAGKDDNGSQFFFTLAATPELQNKHTIFGKVIGETLYNMLKLEEALVDENDRPLYPQKILKTEILNNPFVDISPRIESKKNNDLKESKKEKKAGVKNFKLLSFGEEAEEDEEESVILNKQLNNKSKSAHDCLSDPKLSSQPVTDSTEPPNKRLKESDDVDSESDNDTSQSSETMAAIAKEKSEVTERIKNKLKGGKKTSDSKEIEPTKVTDNDNVEEEEEYYFGKERHEERKRKMNAIKKEIRDLKRTVQNEKKEKEADKKLEDDKEEQKRKQSEILKDYLQTQEEYKKAKQKLPAKGKTREDFTLNLLNKFRNKLQDTKGCTKGNTSTTKEEESKDDGDDELWMAHILRCEEKAPVLAKDASTKNDDWFEIYDPRNPLNKRRRGESTNSSKDSKKDKSHSRRR